jgi:conjugal transfer pilus assembly protein TraE
MLQEQINYIKDNDISRVFYPSVVKVKKGELNVIGVVKDIIGDKVVSNQQVNVKINYKIKQGRFWVTGILVEKAKK